jgi:hypothetical protein
MAGAAPFAGAAAFNVGPIFFLARMLGLNGLGQIVRGAADLDDNIGGRVAGDLSQFETHPGLAAQCWALCA